MNTVFTSFYAELEKIAASIADPVLRAIAKKRVPLKSAKPTGKGKEVLRALKARQGKTRGGLRERIQTESPEATLSRVERANISVDPKTKAEIVGPGFAQAYGSSAPEQYQALQRARQEMPAWQSYMQGAPTTFIPQQRAAQQQLLAGPGAAPPRVATPLAPAQQPPPQQPFAPPGIMGTLRQRLFGGGTAPGTVKQSSARFTPMEFESFRRELIAIQD